MQHIRVQIGRLLFTLALSAMAHPPDSHAAPRASGAVVLPAAVPQPTSANDIVGFRIQNVGRTDLRNRYITFGQVFVEGAVRPGDGLVARVGGGTEEIQASPVALWPDGSVKLAAITMAARGSSEQGMIQKSGGVGGQYVDLANARPALSVTLDFTSGAYSGRTVVDLGAALQRTTDYWFRGPLASQARVDVPVAGGPLHITADVTVYRNGQLTADVQFNNDLTTIEPKAQPALPPLIYKATITLGDHSFTGNIVQWQYQDWHYVVSSDGPAVVNVQHDPAYLERAGVVLPYDLSTGVDERVLNNAARIASAPDFGMPLSANGVTRSMGDTGGRADIGYTTLWNTAWLMTGDWRAAAVGLAQGDAAGAVPWNYKLSDGHWITPAAALEVWTDSRGKPSYANAGPRTSLTGDKHEIWFLSSAHHPDLGYVPYLMTAERWYLDRLNAEAAWSVSNIWPALRCPKPVHNECDIILNGRQQVRAQAWEFREVEEAAFIGAPRSFEENYFRKVVADNFRFFREYIMPAVTNAGETIGWIPTSHWKLDPSSEDVLAGVDWRFGMDNTGVDVAPWQNDFVTGVVALGALMGFDGAKQFIAWQHNWLTGRFLIGPGNNPRDGAAYDLRVSGPGKLTWADLPAWKSNGPSGWNGINTGYYPPLARASLILALRLFPGDRDLTRALQILESIGAPNLDAAYFARVPTFNIAPPR